MAAPMALSKIDIPGGDPLCYSVSLEPPKISGQSLAKLLESNTGHGLDNPTSGGTTGTFLSRVVSTTNTSLKRVHSDSHDGGLGQTPTVASSIVEPTNDLGLAKEDTAAVASEPDSDEEEKESSTANKKISDRRRAQNAMFKSWYLRTIPYCSGRDTDAVT